MYPENHKTIFVLDHTPYFSISTESPLDFDFLKTRGHGNQIMLPPISKSLWTTSIETSMEYCRIVWDLFPSGKLIRFVVSDHSARILNTWSPSQQNLTHLMNAMAIIGVPHRVHQQSTDFSVVHGLRVAIEALSEISETQQEKRMAGPEAASKLMNRGRVICITSARDDASLKSLKNIFLSQLTAQNKQAASSDTLIPVHHCHLVILNIYPCNINSEVTNQTLQEVSSVLSMEVHSLKATILHSKLSHLILEHYDLASTTVTGIPMKEEQNASSSANYDVEIFHSSDAHLAILKGNAQDSALVKTFRRFEEGMEYETVTLKWCTPRGCSASEMQLCNAMHRITPVDVNSRPSSCLINFLLNGRSVMLEMARKSGNKAISHLLASHGGEIFIHTLSTTRSVLEDPPSVSEGCGGRVTDYRITDFGAFMRSNLLVPVKRSPGDTSEGPAEKMRLRLERHTKYWPIVISNTIMYNLRSIIDPLPDLILKESLTKDEVMQCKQIIFSVLQLEAKHENLPVPSIGGGRGAKSNCKREEQYKLLWNELETFLRMHSITSMNHLEVFNCLLEVRNKDDKDNKVELDQALRELEGLGKEETTTRATVIRATTDSPMSPPPSGSTTTLAKQLQKSSLLATKSLLDIWLHRTAPRDRRPDFHGRAGGLKAKLYPNLKENGGGQATRGEPVVEA
ncbi:integrator complex subunit 13 [Copidosoma floridanum]|uniref:integrator complex subunit 13 n=1 Tax=Copidosoma floridanum TaxID=29053 RepID=UPI0006C9BA8F|nr:integrator complex subunit 13 [Copidosoma floridanum]XP_014212608.1 integrator complex subunit 13 [Copidosoma floridanum]XP_014212609.1 integrator complex subunit 13 [Copidosoma floridanum]